MTSHDLMADADWVELGFLVLFVICLVVWASRGYNKPKNRNLKE
jgi:hypothetical protein